MKKRIIAFLCVVSIMTSMLSTSAMAQDSGFFDFSIIGKNPGSFINVSVGVNVTVELDFQKINSYVKNVIFPIKDTKYNKYHLKNVQLKKVDMDSIYFTGDLHVRLYTKGLFGKLWKYVDKTGSCEVRVDYEIDSSGTSITFKKIKASDIKIERNILEYILMPEKLIGDEIIKTINKSKSINEKIDFKFLQAVYIKFSKMYTKGTKLYLEFQVDTASLLDDFIRLLKGQGITVSDVRSSSGSGSKNRELPILREDIRR